MNEEVAPVSEPPAASENMIDIGKWIGRHQALAWVASHCSAANAHTLRIIREQKLYRHLGLTWDQFCPQHAGISSRTAERIIASLKEFGDSYFHLTQIIEIPVTAYRAIQPAIENNTLEFDGRKIPINRENAQQLADAVETLRRRLEKAKAVHPRYVFSHLQAQFDRAIGQLAGALSRETDVNRELITLMVQDHINRATDILQNAGYKVIFSQPTSEAA